MLFLWSAWGSLLSTIIHVKVKSNIFITVYLVIKLYVLRLVIFTQFLVTSYPSTGFQCVVICSLSLKAKV